MEVNFLFKICRGNLKSLEFWMWYFICSHDQNCDPMQLGDLDPKTTFSPHGLDLDPGCMLCCMFVIRYSARDSFQQCNAHSLCAMWSSCKTTLNPDRGSGSSESGFSAHVESPIRSMLNGSLGHWLWSLVDILCVVKHIEIHTGSSWLLTLKWYLLNSAPYPRDSLS